MSLRSTSSQAQLKSLSGLVASKSKWQKWVDSSLDLLFPPRCVGCDRVDYQWCGDCQDLIEQLAIDPQRKQTSYGLKVISSAHHDGLLAQAIHAFKYQNTPMLYHTLSKRLADCLIRWHIQPDCLVPVPLHSQREQERGYNQSALLALGVYEVTGIPYRLDLLKRHTSTQQQVKLDHHERQKNVRDAFNSASADGMTVVLIDDVATTGATLNECARALKQAGASKIYGLTVTG